MTSAASARQEHRIVLEWVPNRDILVYHLTVEISKSQVRSFNRPLAEYEKNRLSELGLIGSLFVRDLLSIVGVKSVSISPYEFHVEKGTAFEWKEIEPLVLRFLRAIYPTGEEILIRTKYRDADEYSYEDQYNWKLLDNLYKDSVQNAPIATRFDMIKTRVAEWAGMIGVWFADKAKAVKTFVVDLVQAIKTRFQRLGRK